MTRVYEGNLNVILSELLHQIGIVSRAEVIQGKKGRLDVLVSFQGLAVVLEGSYSKQDAEADARKRIEQLSADMAIAIYYPSEFPQGLPEHKTKEILQNTRFSAKPIVPTDYTGTLFERLEPIAKSKDNWYEVNLNGLVEIIKEVGQFVISEEEVKKAEVDVSVLIQEFVMRLTTHSSSTTIARNLYEVLYKLYGFSIGKPEEIKEAIFAQASLAILLSSIYYESIRYVYKLDSLDSLKAETRDPKHAIEKAVDKILEIDYEPVFEVTRDMLKAFPPMTRPFNSLLKLAQRIASKKTLLRRDLAGKIYHDVVGEWCLKKGLATYFTQIPTAYLLLRLAKPTLSRLGDLACGSGTLLVAAYSAMNANYRLSLLKQGEDKDPEEIEEEFHTKFIESCYAFDVLEYATQITALNLVFHSPQTPIKDFHVYTLPLGYRKEGKDTSLGSLELVRPTPDLWDSNKKVTRLSMRQKEMRLLQELHNMKPLDLIVMNPPFTRTTGRGGRAGAGTFGFISDEEGREGVKKDYESLREEIRQKLQDQAKFTLTNAKLDFLLKDKEFRPYTSIWQAGEGLLFLSLADVRLKKKGKLCFVLPKGLLSGTSWFLARALLVANYHVEYLVVSYDPVGGANFSESTSLSECLLVARKVDNHKPNEKTTAVILLRKPETSIEAIALANNLETERGNFVNSGNASAFRLKIDREELLENIDNWGRFVFLPNLTLLEEIKDLLSGELKLGDQKAKIPVTKLNNLISTIGVDAKRFDDTFKMVNQFCPGGFKILRGGEEKLRMKMETTPNAYAMPLIERGKTIAHEKSGHLLVPDRIWLDTAHVISLYSKKAILSNIFYALKLKSENPESLKVLCLWLNTTWGILMILANREETRGRWIRLKQTQWRLLPVLDVSQLSKGKLKKLAKIFDEFKGLELPRIPDQYCVGSPLNELRLELDSSFLKALGINVNKNDLFALYQEIDSAFTQWIGA